jgi:hypothetical protein
MRKEILIADLLWNLSFYFFQVTNSGIQKISVLITRAKIRIFCSDLSQNCLVIYIKMKVYNDEVGALNDEDEADDEASDEEALEDEDEYEGRI